jgi:hypothetical protein
MNDRETDPNLQHVSASSVDPWLDPSVRGEPEDPKSEDRNASHTVLAMLVCGGLSGLHRPGRQAGGDRELAHSWLVRKRVTPTCHSRLSLSSTSCRAPLSLTRLFVAFEWGQMDREGP